MSVFIQFIILSSGCSILQHPSLDRWAAGLPPVSTGVCTADIGPAVVQGLDCRLQSAVTAVQTSSPPFPRQINNGVRGLAEGYKETAGSGKYLDIQIITFQGREKDEICFTIIKVPPASPCEAPKITFQVVELRVTTVPGQSVRTRSPDWTPRGATLDLDNALNFFFAQFTIKSSQSIFSLISFFNLNV